MPRGWRLIFVIALCGTLLFLIWQDSQPPGDQTAHQESVAPSRSEYLFCCWNVENLFDDHLDHRTGPGDREYDQWFAEHPDLLQQKLSHLARALVALNDGKGPDILAVCEVESVRAAELLQQALNRELQAHGVSDPAWQYQHVLMKEVSAGRHIAPALLTRLPVEQNRTRLLDKHLRVLEGHVIVDGHELIVFASHWTSQLNKDSEGRRDAYADKIYGAAKAIYLSNPAADFLVAGDFNETPDAEAVTRHLHAGGDLQAVRKSAQPLLYNLMADKDAAHGFGTHYYKHWLIYDQVVVSPGLLDGRGWSCVPDSVQVVNTLHKEGDRQRRPWRFGSERDKGPRGYSDHFPVTVRLRLERS